MDPTGLLEETVQIVLDHDKIDEINNKVLASVDSELAKSERELREKRRRSTMACRRLPTANQNYPTQKTETYDKLAQSSVQLRQAATNLIAMDSQIIQLKAEQAAFEQIIKGVDQLRGQIPGMSDATNDDLLKYLQSVPSIITQMTQSKEVLENYKTSIEEMADDATTADTPLPEGILLILNSLQPDGLAPMTNYGEVKAVLNGAVTMIDQTLPALNALSQNLDSMIEMVGKYDDAKVKLSNVEIEIMTAEGVKQAASKAC